MASESTFESFQMAAELGPNEHETTLLLRPPEHLRSSDSPRRPAHGQASTGCQLGLRGRRRGEAWRQMPRRRRRSCSHGRSPYPHTQCHDLHLACEPAPEPAGSRHRRGTIETIPTNPDLPQIRMRGHESIVNDSESDTLP